MSVRPSVSAPAPAAAGAAMTKTFLTHCFGRSALYMPSRRFFGGWPCGFVGSSMP